MECITISLWVIIVASCNAFREKSSVHSQKSRISKTATDTHPLIVSYKNL
jgi:hypothetical protein